jgi:hypothetical protein
MTKSSAWFGQLARKRIFGQGQRPIVKQEVALLESPINLQRKEKAMPRKPLFGARHRPVMGGAHGGTVHHDPFETLVSHRVAWEFVLGALAVVLTVLVAMAAWTGLQSYAARRAPEVLYSYYHYYDDIENARAARLVNVPAADRTYDSIENLRAARLVSPPLLIEDRSYDAIEAIRANRDLGE